MSENKASRSKFYLKLQKLIKIVEDRDENYRDGSLSHQRIADELNIGYEVFKKRINKQRPTKSRDFIIAIAIVMKLTEEETNDILLEYDYFPTLDYHSERDTVVLNALNEYHEKHCKTLTIDYVNKLLVDLGFNPLDIIHPHSKKSIFNHNIYIGKYSLINPDRIKINISDYYYGRDRLGYSATYHPSRYNCHGNLYIEHKETKKQYMLGLNLAGKCTVMPINNNDTKLLCEKMNNTGEFQSYFTKLRGEIRKEFNRIISQLNDTKNYYERIGVNVVNENIHVFMETFNYSYPETNEYYLFERINGKNRLCIYHQSVFMKLYLENEFKNYYTDFETISSDEYAYKCKNNSLDESILYVPYQVVETVDELDKIINDCTVSIDKQVQAKLWKKAYLSMKEKVSHVVDELKSKTAFARNIEEIYFSDETDRVCDYYGVGSQFECYESGELGTYIAGRTSAIFKFDETGEVEITLSELKRAFELGYSNIKQICFVKFSKANIDNIF